MANEKSRNGGRWTEGRFRSFIASVLRGGTRRWPPKWDALASACVGVRKNTKTGRDAKHYRCAACEELFTSTNVQVDHIEPIDDWSDLNKVVEKLFCEQDKLQILCKPCHKKKTKGEQQSKLVKPLKQKKAKLPLKGKSAKKN